MRVEPGDAFAVPPGMATRHGEPTADVEVLEAALPAAVPTEVVGRA